MSAVRVAGIESELYAALFLILPVEASIQDVQTEIAVNDQVATVGKVRGKSKTRRSLPPNQPGLIYIFVIEQILKIVEHMAEFEGFRSRHHCGPDFLSRRRFLLDHQQFKKCHVGC